ncbi:NAD(P)-binding domain-containing protein [Solirubrobacter ginsenosidimutans]|uniref:NAD(P)-binding domain-containing protein n=1 Tax=Solirubrobacter ginsenosidimutans TaxID=490573 RepID=A0A9X3RZG5_9ACTN|nr:NAD(P)-binding domain-containing protein [Solirubrobacter ginsenosidimutans]MDA0160139.1 NAD(P)-binding domain-containing protein [Solirubrobacter ginsenosidimutans]
MDYGVLGVGAIAAAIVTGLCDDADGAPPVLLSPRNAGIAADLAGRFPTVTVAADNQAVVDGASVVLLCLRPQDAREALGRLRFTAGQVVISAMAGVSVGELLRLVAPATDVARTIPLPSVATRAGITPIHPPNATAKALFDRLGEALEVPDLAGFEALSASTATVAAHFAYLQAISGWLEMRGLPKDEAERYVASLFADLATALRGEHDFAQLARDHATRGGINELFHETLATAGVFDDVRGGLDRVLDRLHAL